MTRQVAPRAAIIIALALSLAGIQSAAAASMRPAWCQEGWQCEPDARAKAEAQELVDLRARVAQLEADFAKCRSTSVGRWGMCVGPSIGILGEAEQLPAGGTAWAWHGGVGASVTWGWRPR